MLPVAAGAVAGTDRVLLHLHGIVGDTRGMVANSFADGVAGAYGAVLAFDYENLHTRIDETALMLQERLTAVGLGPGHGKTLDVVAHSMGGLVARWMIEHLDGARIVSHLVTLGAPNDGSPWPRVQDWAFTALTFRPEALASAFWPAGTPPAWRSSRRARITPSTIWRRGPTGCGSCSTPRIRTCRTRWWWAIAR